MLFVVTEIGAARFMEPLWRRWLGAEVSFDWTVIATETAVEYLRSAGLSGALPMLAPVRHKDEDLGQRLGTWKPTAVVASAGDHYPIEAAAITLARNLGVPSAQYIDTWYNYRRRFEHRGGLQYPDHILVIDDVACREGVGEGLPEERISVVGQPAWEHTLRLGPAPRNHVLFLGAPVRRDFGTSLGFDETSAWRVVVEAAAMSPERFDRLTYGPHPSQGVLSAAAVAPATRVGNSMAALQQASIVLGMFSSPMIDAYIGGRLVVSVQPNAESRDLCALSRHGRIPRVSDARSLIEALDAPVSKTDEFALSLDGSTDRLDAWLKGVVGPARADNTSGLAQNAHSHRAELK